MIPETITRSARGATRGESTPPTSTLLLVGDRFHSFGAVEGVRTVSDFVAALGSGEIDDLRGTLVVSPGQGVEEFQLTYVESAVARRGLDGRVVVRRPERTGAGRDVVHKHRQHNVLLADVRRAGDRRYAASLQVNEDNELLQDHQTGAHVQGMVAVEAARQMFLGAFELGYRHRWPDTDYFVVWNDIDMRFENFLFPVPGEVTCEVRRCDLDDPQRLDFDVRIEIHQGGQRAASASIGFTAFDTGRISAIEHHRAAKAVRHTLGEDGQ